MQAVYELGGKHEHVAKLVSNMLLLALDKPQVHAYTHTHTHTHTHMLLLALDKPQVLTYMLYI
jgi:hypothetical protein